MSMSTVTTSGTSINLWFLIRGSTSIFFITVESDHSVSKLKELIKEKKPNDFANVDSDRLKLLKLKKPVDDSHISNIQNFTLQDGDENNVVVLMKDMRRIDTYWPRNRAPPRNRIHVIVEAPEQPIAGNIQAITEQALFRLAPPTLSFIDITTRTTVKSASRRVPDYPVEPWNDFLENALSASNSTNAIDRKFINHNLVPLHMSEESTVDLFLEVIGNVNGQRLNSLQSPQRWCKRDLATKAVKGEPDIVRIGAPDMITLRSINTDGINLLATVEAKPELLMVKIIREIIEEQGLSGSDSELYNIYNIAREQKDFGTNNYSKYQKLKNLVHQAFGYMVVNDRQYGMITTLNRTWFMRRNKEGDASTLYISPEVLINQLHTDDQASFWECLRYFEDLSTLDPYAKSNPPMSENDDSGDDEGSDNQDDPSPPDKKDKKNKKEDSDYNPSRKRKFSEGGSRMGPRTRNKTKSNATNDTELGETKESILLRYMKNYDRNRFSFGHLLGYGRTGSIFETTLGGKTGALKMVSLYKDENKLEELLNEIKIYIGPLKDIQGIYIPRLLKFGVLYEAFVFILTSLAEETFANMGNNITRKEKMLAIKGLQKLHSKGVMHGDIRLENIMVKRMNEDSTSYVWWIDFGWSKMTDNVKDLNKELTELKYLLGMADTK